MSFDPERSIAGVVGHGLAKGRAHSAVTKAKATGRLPAHPPQCEVCKLRGELTPAGRWTIKFHHWSYLPEHQLDVTAVCLPCHQHIHQRWIDEPTPRLYADPSVSRASRCRSAA